MRKLKTLKQIVDDAKENDWPLNSIVVDSDAVFELETDPDSDELADDKKTDDD